MNNLIATVESIAREAHAGQLYDDRDYVEAHVAPVVGTIAKLGYGEDYQAAGWLHDVLEDNKHFTSEILIQRGVPLRVVTAVELLSKCGEPHEVYLGKIATDKLATVAKYADSSVNLANTVMRASKIDNDRFNRWMTTYSGNIAYLLPRLPDVE